MYAALCYFVFKYVNLYAAEIKFRYVYEGQCPEITSQFNGNMTTYLEYALHDRDHLYRSESIGIYQCYCLQQVKSMSDHFTVFTDDPAFSVCRAYLAQGIGGSLLTMPSGLTNAMFTNIGAILVSKIIDRIGYHSTHYKNQVTLVAVFILAYYNAALLLMIRFDNHDVLPCIFSP